MSDRPKPRFANVTAILGADILSRRQSRLQDELDSVKQDPSNLLRYSGVAHSHYLIAVESWALGYPLDTVIDSFKKSVETEIASNRPGHGVSWDTFETTCVALAIGHSSAARKIAGFIADAPDANYIGRNSEVCTPEQQKVAYAFRDVYLGNPAPTLGDMGRISLLWKVRGFPKDVAYVAGIVRAWSSSDKKGALESLSSLIQWHAHAHDETDRGGFLFLVPLGLSALLISCDLVSIDQLPQHDVRFPLEILLCGTKRARRFRL